MRRPLSARKLAANRANAQKSTGPRTPEGKRCSSQNARRHPLRSTAVAVRDGRIGERASDFARLLKELHADLRPQSAPERMLVDRIASCFWRLQRAQRFEVAAIRQRLDQPPALDPLAEQRRLLLASLPPSRDLDRLIRYESAWDRELHRAIDHLHRLKDRRRTLADLISDLSPPTKPRCATPRSVADALETVQPFAGATRSRFDQPLPYGRGSETSGLEIAGVMT